MEFHPPEFQISKSPTASVLRTGENHWHLEIPAGNRFQYRLAQIDDHGLHRRSDFHWNPPLSFSLKARISNETFTGTWGFGLWNDPFSFAIAYNRPVPRLPTLPDAAWFFFASTENYLSVYDHLPANKFLAATFSSSKIPAAQLILSLPILALTLIPGTSRNARRFLRRWIKQDAAQVQACLTDWHDYCIEWEPGQIVFYMDQVKQLETAVVPHSPLCLVIWIDNHYAALPPGGRLKYGLLANANSAWIEVEDILVQEGA